MKRTLFLVSAAMALGACASAPAVASNPAVAMPVGCSEIAADIGRTEQALALARDKEANAWKAVVPFAVAARYMSGKNAGDEAEQRLAALQEASKTQGCTVLVGGVQ